MTVNVSLFRSISVGCDYRAFMRGLQTDCDCFFRVVFLPQKWNAESCCCGCMSNMVEGRGEIACECSDLRLLPNGTTPCSSFDRFMV